VPKGVQELDIAWALVNEMLVPENQALMSKLFVSSPTNPDAMKLIDPETQAWLPTTETNLKQGILLDEHYWGTNMDTILARWQSWLLT
jgi:spermidine/putrescine-binding protein